MVQMQDTRDFTAPGQSTSISKITNLLGAAASMALVIGIGVWSYQLLMRDVSGVPVVRAVDGPMRVQPENPGGEQAQHQGLSVNDVAAEGAAGAPADRLVLAPAPLELTVEDEALPSVGEGIDQQNAETIQPAVVETSPGGESVINPDDLQLAAVEQLASRLAEGVDPLQELAPVVEEEQSNAEAVDAAVQSAVAELAEPVEGGMKRSLRPKLRPATLSNVQPVAAIVSSDGPKDIDPASIPAGTRLAQLGAYDSAETAQKEWDRLQGKFAEYLDGKDRIVQKATSGGRTFYRLRAMGFADLSDARRFCSALVAENAECIPVVTR